ncbi:MAG: hypothetical protein EON54_04510 [Alcaligenaceae bacterium]|nr:MAG: hypothetical protein EON54_04510 [Alcaligenaceae bacterium]
MMSMSAQSHEHANLAAWVHKRARMAPETEALVYWHTPDVAEHWTYGELHRDVMALACWMSEQGIQPGDRVAFLDFNDARFVVTMFATAHLGALFVPLNFRLSEPELIATLQDCEAALLIVGASFAVHLEHFKQASCCRHYLVSDREGVDEYGAICSAHAHEHELPMAQVGWDDCAWLLYTSGSTGRPKGVMLTHGNIFWNTFNTILAQGGLQADRVLVSAPLFHAAPVSTFMESFLRGAELHLERNFDADRLLRRIAHEGIVMVAGVPSMYALMAASALFDEVNLDSLRAVIIGGAPLPQALIARYNDRGIKVIQRYGLTEAAPLVCALAPSSPTDKRMTAGQAPLFADVRICDVEGQALSADMIGEIRMRGPNVMAGYWRNPIDTSAAIQNRWLLTGDLGSMDANGYITIHGRSKDMIISGGENVYAVEVESRLAEDPAILESAVIGVPDPKWGEAVCAIVSLRVGRKADAQSILAHLNGRLARYKQPRSFIFLPALPKNGAGKIDKLSLKRRYAGLA